MDGCGEWPGPHKLSSHTVEPMPTPVPRHQVSQPSQPLRGLTAWLRRGPSDDEARRRFAFYSVFVALGMPVMIAFAGADFLEGRYLVSCLTLAAGASLLTGWFSLRVGYEDLRVYRGNAMAFGVMVVYMVMVGGDQGSWALWLFAYPPVVIFLLGEWEGGAWAAASFVPVAVLLWIPLPGWHAYSYPPAFKARYATMYVVMTTLILAYEVARRRYRDDMRAALRKLEADKQLLSQEIEQRERAEAEREMLKGLVPICSHCHRIRDDHGYWSQLEIYMHEHADVEFSHGICPTCLREKYPEVPQPS
jgi:hypothetical protein